MPGSREQSKGRSSSLTGFDKLCAGYEFPSSRHELKASVVAEYRGAVGAPDKPGSPLAEFVPPVALAAYTMNAVAQSMELPAGTIHTSQELEFLKPVPVGAVVSCGGRVAQRVDRGRLHMVIIGLEALNQEREKVLTGQATLIMPG